MQGMNKIIVVFEMSSLKSKDRPTPTTSPKIT
jgi:hypothetical protein